MAFRVFRSLASLPTPRPGLVLCIGNFDGVHRGHHKIFARVIRDACQRKGAAAVLTFDPHPGKILRPSRAPKLLTPLEARLRLFEEAGLDRAFVFRFSQPFSRYTPQEFVEKVLVKRLGVESVYVGTNFRFGKNQTGTPDLLKMLAHEHGFRVHLIAPLMAGGEPVSSTRIRQLIFEGQVRAAARLLGRPYALSGKIIRGAGRGGGLGFPTVNCVPQEECLPSRGVYVTETRIGKKTYPSVTNIGIRPTFKGKKLLVESYLLRSPRSLRSAQMEVSLLHRLRDEIRFPSREALQRQIARDVERAKRFFPRQKDRKKR